MILTRAPLRVPIGGGGTDLASYYTRHGGFFISAAVDKYVYVTVNRPAADELIRVKYSRSEEVDDHRQLQHDLVREALETLCLTKNLEITSMADVPAGTGMGSSGSYLVALLAALHCLKRDHRARTTLAEEACHIEVERAQHSVGKQDQYAAAFGGLNCYEIDQDGHVTITPLEISSYVAEELESSLCLFYTGKTRLSDEILAQQKNDTEGGNAGVIDSLHRTKELGYRIKDALEHGDLVCFGRLLDEHWQNKKARSHRISDGRIDHAYSIARSNGALGGKLIGAGGGGFLLLLAEKRCQRHLRAVMQEEGFRYMSTTFDMEGAKVLVDI
jgi:D-glycero-alpha-D-manno-heptose-7-phosphate kinase